ncbi:MAG TPA: YeeE/YedE thiosulfate transporter family protein [Phycisphaerae bacterium]|nr:YeeE/YedE thiosulfate transporter family protein [Phycisphaerae bacterium]HNU45258.1 YeeE/YedE thiosulfate transporter family protein [Phycisphaerae bacterium]
MNETTGHNAPTPGTRGVTERAGGATRPDVEERLRQIPTGQPGRGETGRLTEPASPEPRRTTRRKLSNPLFLVGCFAVLNVIMYLTIQKFWIGGSSFLPLIGILGDNHGFLFAFLVNVGVVAGALVGALSSGEFRLRLPRKRDLAKAIVGGFLIGMGITVAPGTCTTAFVTGIPMLSVSSFLSVAGIFIGAHLIYGHTLGRQ